VSYELDDGLLIALERPTFKHQDVASLMSYAVRAHARASRQGRPFAQVDVYLPDGRIYLPDFGFLGNDKLDQVCRIDGKIHGAPTMVAEVMSSEDVRDRTRKFHVYFDNGIEWLWLVSQSLVIEEYHATEPGYVRVSTTSPGEVFRPQLFPGLEVNLAALLRETEQETPDSSEQSG